MLVQVQAVMHFNNDFKIQATPFSELFDPLDFIGIITCIHVVYVV